MYFADALIKWSTSFEYFFLLVLPPHCCSAAMDIISLTSIHASPYLDKLYFDIEALNLIWLLTLYVPRKSSFISTQLFVQNLDV